MRIKGTDRKALEKLAAGVALPDGYDTLYPATRGRIVDLLSTISTHLEGVGLALAVEAPEGPNEKARRLADAFGLTATEARMALFLADGGTLGAYATAHKVSLNTARTHLRGVFQKAGVNRQADLVRLVVHHIASLAP